jgi:hypothetical protein
MHRLVKEPSLFIRILHAWTWKVILNSAAKDHLHGMSHRGSDLRILP